MQSPSRLQAVIGSVATCALLSCLSETRGADKAKDDAAIRKLIDAGIKAYNDHDAGAWSMIFHPDADYTNVIGWTLHGRDEIETYFGRLFATERHPKLPSFKNATVKADGAPKIRFRRDDMATVRCHWTMTGALGLDDKETPKRNMLMTLVITKEKGAWGIASYHNMDLRPGQPKDTPAEFLKKP